MRKSQVSKEMLSNLYLDEDLSFREIARKLNVDTVTIKRWCKEFHIPFKDSDITVKEYKPKVKKCAYTDKEDFLFNYERLGSLKELAKYYKVSESTVSRWRNLHDIPTIPTIPIKDKEFMTELYVVKNLSVKQISEQLNEHPIMVRRWIRIHQLKKSDRTKIHNNKEN